MSVPRISCITGHIAWTLCMLVGHVAAAPLRVGSSDDPACDFTSIHGAIAAAAQSGEPAVIHITRSRPYERQAVQIGAQDVTLIGGFDDCADQEPSGLTLLSGQGGAAHPVVRFTGAGVRRLRHLEIVGGDPDRVDRGGGIDILGSGELALDDVYLHDNAAANGAGLRAAGEGGALEVVFDPDVFIGGNHAGADGGGVHLSGPVRLRADGDAIIAVNSAGGRGGGLFVAGPAVAEFGAPLHNVLPIGALHLNAANEGGGVALSGTSQGRARLTMRAAAGLAPVTLSANRAQSRGGAIHAAAAEGSAHGVSIELDSVLMMENRAANGAAIHAGGDGTTIVIVASGSGSPSSRREDCGEFGRCTAFNDNLASAPDGSVVQLVDGAQLVARRSQLARNVAATLFDVSGGAGTASSLSLHDCLLTSNRLRGALARVRTASDRVGLRGCTITGNEVAGAAMVRVDAMKGSFELLESIVDQPADALLAPIEAVWPDGVIVRHNLLDVLTSIAPDAGNLVGRPRFADPEHGDFGLRAGSQAVDFAPAATSTTDLDGEPRDVDLSIHANREGTRDLGAFELQSVDNLVVNADFRYDDGAWRWPPGIERRWSALGAQDGRGSIEVRSPVGSTASTIEGASHCVPLPAAGSYELDGFGDAGADAPAPRSRLGLRWNLRRDGEDCAGPIDASGELSFAEGEGWQAASAPVAIGIGAHHWSEYASLEIVTVVSASTDAITEPVLLGRFDRIALRYVAAPQPAAVFGDGFE